MKEMMLLLDLLKIFALNSFFLSKSLNLCIFLSFSFLTERCSHSCISRSASVSCCDFEGIINIFSKIFLPNSTSYPSSTSWASTSWGTRISFKLFYVFTYNLMLSCYYRISISFHEGIGLLIFCDVFVAYLVPLSLQIDELWLWHVVLYDNKLSCMFCVHYSQEGFSVVLFIFYHWKV